MIKTNQQAVTSLGLLVVIRKRAVKNPLGRKAYIGRILLQNTAAMLERRMQQSAGSERSNPGRIFVEGFEQFPAMGQQNLCMGCGSSKSLMFPSSKEFFLSKLRRIGNFPGIRKSSQSPFDAIAAKMAADQAKQTALHRLRPSHHKPGSLNKLGRIAGRKIQRHPTPGAARYGIHEMRPAIMPADSALKYLWLSFDAYAADGQAAKKHSPWRQ